MITQVPTYAVALYDENECKQVLLLVKALSPVEAVLSALQQHDPEGVRYWTNKVLTECLNLAGLQEAMSEIYLVEALEVY